MGATQKLLGWLVVACCLWGSCGGALQASEEKTPEKQASAGKTPEKQASAGKTPEKQASAEKTPEKQASEVKSSAFMSSARADQGAAVFQRLSIEEGLSQSEVNTLAFDREGYLWIGTQDGLNRYDGTQFEVFRHDPRDATSISHDFIHSVVMDHAGEVWFNTKTGFDRWDPLRRAFERYQLPLLPGKEDAEPVVLLYPSKRGGLYIVSNSSALYYLPPGEKLPQLLLKPSESVTLIRELLKVVLAEDNHLDLWFATQSVPLMRYRPNTQEILPIPTDKELPEGWGGGTLFDIYPQKDGTLWLASEKGLFYRPADTLRFLPVTVPFQHGSPKRRSFISCIEAGPGSTLWLGTTEGLFSVDTLQRTVKPIPFRSPVSEPGRYITSVHTDKQGMLWVGTLSFSIHRYDPQEQALIEYQDTRGEVLPQDGMMVMALTSDDAGNLWMGGMGALWKISRNRDVFFNLLHNTKREPSLSDPMVWGLMETPDQHLWIATGDGTLNELTPEGKAKVHRPPPSTPEAPTWRRALSHMVPLNAHELVIVSQDGFVSLFDRRTERFGLPPWSLALRDERIVDAKSPDIVAQKIKLIPNIPLGFYPIGLHGIGSILSLMVDKQGDLWLGTQTGLYRKRAHESILKLVHVSMGTTNLDQLIVNVLTRDPNGRLLLTLNDVLMWYDPQTNKLEEVLKSKRLKKEIPAAHLMAAFLQGEHILWLGTQGHGLYRVDLKEQNYRMLTSADGLPNNTLYAVLEDRSKKLWWSSNLGLVRLDPQTLALRSYQACDGLQSNEFNQAAATVGPTGTLYFGGVQGVTYFHPERLQDNPVAPKISIKTLRKFDVISPLQRDEAGTLNAEIGYKENYFSIEYVALDLTDPRQNRYRYRLQGFENDWHEVGSQRIASYTSLPGGTYQFQVQASNNHGIWNEEGASLQVVVIPPPWKTWWAYTLYALTPLLALYAYARAQAQRLEKERAINEQLRRVDRLKDEFLANTSHELRTPLNGIIGLAESMVDGATGELNRETLANLDMIVTSGRRLSHLINDILDFSRLRHRDLSLARKAMSLQPVVELVITLLKPLTAGKKLVMYNDLTPELPLVEADENRLQQIFNNLIGNALKFTEQGEIHVYAMQHGEHLEITIADTGIGIPEDKLDSVFQSFEQVDGSISRKYGGTGLGLAITRQLVELHGGTIYCESTLGKGSKFTFTLPVSKGSNVAVSAAIQEEHASSSASSTVQVMRMRDERVPEIVQLEPESGVRTFRLLLVDDEPVNLQVLVNHLSGRRYDIILATSGQEALARLEAVGSFDLVILDVMMPGMSGFEVCRRMRTRFSPGELPVILLTARNQIADLVEGFNAGANDYLTKPVSKHELLARTRMHLQLSKLTAAYSRFVPREFLEHLSLESILDVKLGDHVLKEMTILFSDIRSFTSLSERMTPEENFRFVNSYLERMEPVIRNHRGFIDKYIGDAIMALFSGGADDAVQAAIAMLLSLTEYNAGRVRAGYEPIHIGIGLNTGNLMLGTVGGPDRMDGTVISDAVNLASRIEGLTKMYGASILLTDRTRERLKQPQLFAMRMVDRVIVKGRSEPVEVYEVFDGDPTHLRDGKLATLDLWQTGQRLYQQGDFCSAKEAFAACLRLCPDDVAARIYLKRCEKTTQERPSEGWDGVTVMDHK